TATLGPGDHTVGLEIVDDNGTKTDVTHTIHIDNTEPTGDFSPASTPVNHQPITLHATVSDPDQGLSAAPTYTWDLNNDNTFGDGSFDNSDASVTFGPGDHKVVLRVTDSDGKSVDVPKTIHIDNTKPTADFSCSPAVPGAGQTVTCTASDSDPDHVAGDPALIEKWDWNGNGTTNDPTDKAGHVVVGHFTVGSHKISLHVIDGDGGET